MVLSLVVVVMVGFRSVLIGSLSWPVRCAPPLGTHFGSYDHVRGSFCEGGTDDSFGLGACSLRCRRRGRPLGGRPFGFLGKERSLSLRQEPDNNDASTADERVRVTIGVGVHKVAVIGGDGIGREVIAEALKVVAAAGIALDTVDYDLGWPLRAHRGKSCPNQSSKSSGPPTPSCSVRSVRPSGRRPSRRGDGAWAALEAALRAGPVHQSAPLQRGPGLDRREPTSSSCARTPKGRMPAKAGRSAVARRSRSPPRVRLTRLRRRALHPFRLRAFRGASTPSRDPRAQDQCPHLCRRPLAADFRRGGGRTPRRGHGLQPRRCRLHLLCRESLAVTTWW